MSLVGFFAENFPAQLFLGIILSIIFMLEVVHSHLQRDLA